MNAFGPRAGGLRLIRIVVVCIAIGTCINTGGGVLLFVLNGNRVNQINRERQRNTETSCVRDSAQNAQILAFLDSRGASPRMIEDARQFFPVRSAEQCAVMAARQVDTR